MKLTGRSKNDLKRIQAALKAEGFDPGPIDGKNGPRTDQAATAWETERAGWARGIDISSYQPRVDWATVAKDGVSWMLARASVSVYKDALCDDHIKAAKAAGLLVGAYHFFAPWRSPEEQAKIFLAQVKGLPIDLPLVTDVEALAPKAKEGEPAPIPVTTAQLVERTAAFMAIVEKETGRRPTLYTYSAFSTQHKLGVAFGATHRLHIADYREGPPTVSAGWGRYAFHQHAGDNGRQAGVLLPKGKLSPCDLNVYRGSLEQLKLFCQG